MKLFENSRKNQNKKTAHFPAVIIYLSYFLLVTTVFSGTSISKFTTVASATATARVAYVELKTSPANAQDSALNIDQASGSTSTGYSFYVTNGASEVSLDYQIMVSLPEMLPEGLKMALLYDGTECSYSQLENTFIFDGGADFAPGVTANHNYTLTFTANDTLTENIDLSNISIRVKAQQID